MTVRQAPFLLVMLTTTSFAPQEEEHYIQAPAIAGERECVQKRKGRALQ